MFSKLDIKVQARDGKTFLKDSFCSPPFKLADVTETRSMSDLRLMIMSSSPGILDGDEYQLSVELSENSSLHLETQSYQRLFQMKNGARQDMEVNMNKASSFVYLPHPVVPHENSKFVARNNIFMSDHCSLTWGEVLTCGRKLNGERFSFSTYHNITEIFLRGRLVVKENLLMQPLMIDPSSIGQLEGFTHQATLIMISEQISVKQMIEAIRKLLVDENEIVFGVSELQVNGLIVRILGSKAEQLFQIIKKLAILKKENSEKEKHLHAI